MNVQRFIGKDNNDAMMKVKRELGSEAVILHTRKIRGKGFFSFFKKPLVEIVAAIESRPERPTHSNASSGGGFIKHLHAARAQQNLGEDDKTEISQISTKVEDLTSLVQNVLDKVSDNKTVAPTMSAFYKNKFIHKLIDQDVDDSILKRIEQGIIDDIGTDFSDEMQFKTSLSMQLHKMIGLPFKLSDAKEKRKIFCFVGPTGVGKTTTIAKIAAKLSLVDNYKVSLITADTYRIAAVDQLKTYSEILSIPLDVIYEPEDVFDILKKYEDKDYILIDTAGRNHKDDAMHVDVRELLDCIEGVNVFLVMSCTSSIKDVKRIIQSYDFIDDYTMIFTKIDEAESYGNLLNAHVVSHKQLAYITNGQSVPDDIIVADPEQIISLLLGESNERSSAKA